MTTASLRLLKNCTIIFAWAMVGPYFYLVTLCPPCTFIDLDSRNTNFPAPEHTRNDTHDKTQPIGNIMQHLVTSGVQAAESNKVLEISTMRILTFSLRCSTTLVVRKSTVGHTAGFPTIFEKSAKGNLYKQRATAGWLIDKDPCIAMVCIYIIYIYYNPSWNSFSSPVQCT